MTLVWLKFWPCEVEYGSIVHVAVHPSVQKAQAHVVLVPNVKLLPQIDLIEPALLSKLWPKILHFIGLKEVQQIEKLLLICRKYINFT